jgi:hypothetical protein
MIPSKQHHNMPPRQIECHSTSLVDLLQVQGPPLAHSLVDYSTFRAPTKDTNLKDCACIHIQERSASTHEKRLTLLRERQNQRKSVLKQQSQQSQESVRVSMVDLVPPTCNRSCSDGESDEESEVMFALKVSTPARLVPRRRGRRLRGSIQNWGNGSIAALSLLDGSMTLQSMAANTLHQEEEETPERAQPETPAHSNAKAAMGDFSQTCMPNHDSFQTSANFPAPAVLCKPDPRKQRKSMMNWLANRLPSKHLLEPPCKDPPMFVKVIYLPSDQTSAEDEDEDAVEVEVDGMEKQNHKSPDESTDTKLEGMGSTHSRCSIVVNHQLENSHHRKVASSMA